MSIEKSFSNNNEKERIQSLSEMLPFVNLPISEEEKSYNSELKKASELLTSGKMQEFMDLTRILRDNIPKNEEVKFTKEQEQAFDTARAKIAEQLGYTVKSNNGKFLTLEKDEYNIQMKHFMLPNVLNINEGRIYEIAIGKGNDYAAWANGDEEFKDEGMKKIFDELINHLS